MTKEILKVFVGTRHPEEVAFFMDDYATCKTRNCSDVEELTARNILKNILTQGKSFANDGHRNNDAVNLCIALHVLGYDPEEWISNFTNDGIIKPLFYECDLIKFMEHVERVCGYIHQWGPAGNEQQALKYAL